MAYNDPNRRPTHRTTGGDWWEDEGHRADNLRNPHWQADDRAMQHPVNAAFGTGMGNFGQIVYDPYFGVDSFGYFDETQRRYGDASEDRARKETGRFRGVGPKTYVRPDDRIGEAINDFLTEDPWLDASDIKIDVNNGDVILSGMVNDREAKRRAMDIVEAIYGVRNVENRIRIRRDDASEYNFPTATTSLGATNTESKAERKSRSKK